MSAGRIPTTANSPLTAKGDLFTYSTAPARLAVGNDGEQIVADSSATTGLRYQAPVQQNPLLNSAFQVWQRGTSIAIPASTSTYSADRWTSYRSAATGSTVSRQVTGDTTNLPNIQYCARVQRDLSNTSTAILYFTQAVESINTIPFAGKAIVFSFYARAGANYSATSNVLVSQLTTGTGTDQAPYAGYTGTATPFVGNHTLTTTWQRFTATGTIGATTTEMLVQFQMTPTGTAGANDYFEVTGIQLEVGTVATPFHTYAATIQGETSACQRYYVRMGGTAAFEYLGAIGNAGATTNADVMFVNMVTMRTTPSAIEYSLLSLYDGVAIPDCTALSALYSSPKTQFIRASASSLTQYRSYQLITRNSTSAYLAFSAEL